DSIPRCDEHERVRANGGGARTARSRERRRIRLDGGEWIVRLYEDAIRRQLAYDLERDRPPQRARSRLVREPEHGHGQPRESAVDVVQPLPYQPRATAIHGGRCIHDLRGDAACFAELLERAQIPAERTAREAEPGTEKRIRSYAPVELHAG